MPLHKSFVAQVSCSCTAPTLRHVHSPFFLPFKPCYNFSKKNLLRPCCHPRGIARPTASAHSLPHSPKQRSPPYGTVSLLNGPFDFWKTKTQTSLLLQLAPTTVTSPGAGPLKDNAFYKASDIFLEAFLRTTKEKSFRFKYYSPHLLELLIRTGQEAGMVAESSSNGLLIN